MDWKLASFAALGLWATYMIFGTEAGKIHGEKVNMCLEASAMVAVAVTALLSGGLSDFARVTPKSFAFAALMGLMSAGGLYVQLYAMRIAPQEISLIALISGMWPVATVVLVAILRMGNPLLPRQWLGVAFAGIGLALVNWAQ